MKCVYLYVHVWRAASEGAGDAGDWGSVPGAPSVLLNEGFCPIFNRTLGTDF